MSEKKIHPPKSFTLKAKLPVYFRYAAIVLLGVTLAIIGVSFYRSSSEPDFRMISLPTSLSKDVVAVVNGYERREMEGDVVRYYIKADKGTTFSDNHQELENVYLEVFDAAGASDKITADKAIYIPEENKNFTGYFAGNVNIETRDALKVRTEQVAYRRSDEIATAEELIEFERNGVKGRSVGAIVKVAEKKLELLHDVQIDTYESPELAASDIKQASIKASYAIYDQPAETIEFRNGMEAHIVTRSGTSDVKAGGAFAFLVASSANSRDMKRLELHENVWIRASQPDAAPAEIRSGSAVYERDIDRFDLRNSVSISTAANGKPTNITSNAAVYEQGSRKIFIDGNAEITHGNEYLKGDHIYAELHPGNRLKLSNIRGNAYLRQSSPERTTEVSAAELNAGFDEHQNLRYANAVRDTRAVLTPANLAEYSRVTMSAPNAIRVRFKGEGLIEQMATEGRTTVQMEVPNSAQDAAHKRVSADTVKTVFNSQGKDIQRAEAVGNAELYVEPLNASPENYRTTVRAPRFDCDFFPTGNSPKGCTATTRTSAVRVPTVKAPDRGDQTLTANRLVATFGSQTRDVERIDAVGQAKFVELDRNATATEISFTKSDEIVRLRGASPTVWDSRARAKANEIDWDTKNQRSYLRGAASTTYYSQGSAGGSLPFGATDKPVYLTAKSAEFDHRAETANYLGNARAWQDSNYVRADRLLISQRDGRFFAEGNVNSLLSNIRRRERGKESNAPVHVSARSMAYNRTDRLVRYENDVDIRQGTDRIIAGIANIYLDERNEVSRSEIERNVVITQPNRRAVGDYAQYIAAEERVTLRGNPARVEDATNGSSSGGEMTVYLRDNRVISDGRSKQNSGGRIRSVYKVKSN